MRAALYARYSTDLQREASLEDQFRQCERTARVNGFTVVARFSDAGISGGTAERPGYQGLLAAARRREFDVVVTEDVSRLWRNRATYGQDSAELEDLGLQLVTCVGDDTRRDGWGLMLTIKAAMAEHQRRETSYRTRRALEGLALAGRHLGGRRYGYYGARKRPSDPEPGSVNPVEAAVVRRIFEERAAGVGPYRIATALNRERVRAALTNYWDGNAIKRILSNPRYAGRVEWGSTVSQGGARDSRHKRRVLRLEGPLVVRQESPIVDPALWTLVNGREPGA